MGEPPTNPRIGLLDEDPMCAEEWRRVLRPQHSSALVCLHRAGPLIKADIESMLDDGCGSLATPRAR